MQKYLIVIIVILVVLFCLYIDNQNSIPVNVSNFYDEFLSIYASGTFSDLEPYLHFELPQYKILIEDIYSNIRNYRIEGWEKINEYLWVARTYIETNQEPDGIICYHFIGEIEQKLYVMIGAYQVPEQLLNGEDLSRFIPSSALPPDVTFFDLE